MAKTRVGQISPLYYKKVAGHLPLIQDASQRVGNVFYVDSGDGTDSTGYGTHPDTPFATLDYAIGQCTANQGDVIFVLPGHAETIAAAAGIDADIAGISIIGLGDGADRPTITFATSTAADMDIDAASITVRNLIFVCGIDEQVLMIDVNAANFTIEDCEFRGTAAAQFLTAIDVNGGAANACDRATIRRCKFVSYTAAATANDAISLDEVADEVAIEDCVIDGDWGNAGIHNPTGKVLTNLRLLHNVVRNRQTGDHAIELVSACTGELIDNRLFGDTLGTILDPGSLFCAGNLESDAIDQAGVDSPRVAAGGLPDDSITAASIATGAIDADAIADNAIDAGAIAVGAIAADAFAAGAIDAAAIAVGAIAADAFAAGAIDAAAIANAAIDAATFAAGAIDAAAIATGAIDADAIADNAIDAGAIAADAITNAKIADNALATEQFALSAGEKTTDGVVVTKATAALPQTAAAAIFTVTGLVLLKRLVGYVTVQIGAVANATKLVGNSTGAGASTDLCGTLDINGHVVDSRYEIDAVAGFAGAMIRTLDVPLVLKQTVDLVIPPGTIDLNCAGSDGGTGRVRWSATYVPLEAGAQIVAA